MLKTAPLAATLVLCLTASTYAQSPDLYISSTYDRFRDQTRVQLIYPMLRQKDLTVSLLALGVHRGRTPSEPPALVVIGMYFQAKKGIVDPDNKELLALADGEPLDFGEAIRLQLDGIEDSQKSAAFGALAPYGAVRKLAEATRPEFKFFGVTGNLPADAQVALNTFLRKLRA